jgi:hypothetical protein
MFDDTWRARSGEPSPGSGTMTGLDWMEAGADGRAGQGMDAVGTGGRNGPSPPRRETRCAFAGDWCFASCATRAAVVPTVSVVLSIGVVHDGEEVM